MMEKIFGDHFTDEKMVKSPYFIDQYFKRRMEMDTNGFYGDTFSSGFGDFYTAKRSKSIKNKNLTRKSE